MNAQEKMRCPNCGDEMNRHAEKIDYTAALEQPDATTKDFGGVLMSFHECPTCGTTQSRIET